jgi:hypothetical protein
MASEALVEFCTDYLPQHPELKHTIDARGDRKEFARAVVAAGAEAGYLFSEGDVDEVITAPRDELSDGQLDGVSGGITCRKAGKEQQEYMTFTLNDLLVSS